MVSVSCVHGVAALETSGAAKAAMATSIAGIRIIVKSLRAFRYESAPYQLNGDLMQIRVLAFAHLREALGQAELACELPSNATAGDAWTMLAQRLPALAAAGATTRFARNGALVSAQEPLRDGDELALLPPVGGG